MPKRQNYRKKHTKKDAVISKKITKKRISRKLGIFNKGSFSGSIFRDPNQLEETKARAEEDLAKILALAKPTMLGDNDSYDLDVDERTQDLNKYKVKKRKKEKEKFSQFPLQGKRTKLNSGGSPFDMGQNSPTEDCAALLHVKESSASHTEKTKKNYVVPYEDFYKCISQNLKSVTATKKEDMISKFQEELDNLCLERLILTPPSADLLLSDFLKDEQDSDHEEDHSLDTSSTVSPLHPIGTKTPAQHAFIVSNVKRKPKIKYKSLFTSGKCLPEEDILNSSITLLKLDFDEEFLKFLPKGGGASSESKYADASCFLKRYENLKGSHSGFLTNFSSPSPHHSSYTHTAQTNFPSTSIGCIAREIPSQITSPFKGNFMQRNSKSPSHPLHLQRNEKGFTYKRNPFDFTERKLQFGAIKESYLINDPQEPNQAIPTLSSSSNARYLFPQEVLNPTVSKEISQTVKPHHFIPLEDPRRHSIDLMPNTVRRNQRPLANRNFQNECMKWSRMSAYNRDLSSNMFNNGNHTKSIFGNDKENHQVLSQPKSQYAFPFSNSEIPSTSSFCSSDKFGNEKYFPYLTQKSTLFPNHPLKCVTKDRSPNVFDAPYYASHKRRYPNPAYKSMYLE